MIKAKRKTGCYSLWRRVSACLTIIYVVLLLLMFINNAYATYTMRQQIYNQLYDMLYREKIQLTSELNAVSTFLSSYSLDAPNFFIVEQYKEDSEYYSALYKLKTELRNALTSISVVQGMFVFPTTSKQLIMAASDSQAEVVGAQLRSWIRNQDEQELEQCVLKQWFPLKLDGKYYLVRFLKIGKSYVGAWTDFTCILSRFSNFQKLQWIPLFVQDSHHIYNIDSQQIKEYLNLNHTDSGLQMIDLDQTYLAVSTNTGSDLKGTLCLLVPSNQISAQLKSHYTLTALMGAFFILLAVITIFVLRRYMHNPILQLKDSLIALRNGNFSARIPNENTCSEFADVNTAFNQMVERIEALKINVYEEQLLSQKTQMKALKNQIAPHFLINCLNAIYHMTATGDHESIRHMTVCLGEHLRYALADTSVVTLAEELSKVENYVSLSHLRFPDSIDLILEIDENVKATEVLPMIILFQVENIIKYEVINGEITQIHIECGFTIYKNSNYVFIRIWDTGRGYAPDILTQLNSASMLNQSNGHNIGTKNIYQRLHLMYQDNFLMKFSNHEAAGAQVDIKIPAYCKLSSHTEVNL